MPEHVSDAQLQEILKEDPGMIMVDLWADWCMPCKAIEPYLESASREFGIRLLKLNVDENSMTPATYGVMSIPTVLCFKDGKLVGKIVGAKPKMKIYQEIKSIFKLDEKGG